jgi:hypothetical protein
MQQNTNGIPIDQSKESLVATPSIPHLQTTYDLYSNIVLGLLIGAGAIAVFIAAFSVLSSRKSGELMDAKDRQLKLDLKDKDDQIAVAQEAAGKANERAGRLEHDNLILRPQVATLETEAANARTAQLRMQKDLANAQIQAANAIKAANDAAFAAFKEQWEREQMSRLSFSRKLNILREREYVEQLRPYAGTKFFVVTLSDTEPFRVGRLIENLLDSAGWEREPMVRMSDADEAQVPDGIWIESNGPIVGPPPSPLKPAMEALRDVLNDSEIPANRSFLNPLLPPAQLPPNTLRVVIGLRGNLYFDLKKVEEEMRRERDRRLAGPPPESHTPKP